ncbi:hypothetical protein BN975_01644 [Mycolicibacterium farcinogenes]|uniref:Uncharacterized protein n=1 Tax=Mycolicibacterium senegalense TaxID=1796 RepID=A0A378W4W9_9MYCO|nr:hypothetical protein BN975_01644 [Mycolicibacterium farcinogenes]SUA27298.1 Uncharacterised protein [Mycolicibacterium senegalense]
MHRRLDQSLSPHHRHYEKTLVAHEDFVYPRQIALLLRRPDRSQLFDTF